MKESVLQTIWQYKLFEQHGLLTATGLPVEIIDVGKTNMHAGPDFFNAKIRIGDTLWAGNVEIHPVASDWYRHGHHTDPAYRNVILHVVQQADVEVRQSEGRMIPQLELKLSPAYVGRYEELIQSKSWIACDDKLKQIPAIYISTWKNSLLVERLQMKVADIDTLLEREQNYWENVLYQSLCRSFGFSINGDAFAALAVALPWHVVQKNRDQLFRLEALFLGQSGLLNRLEYKDDYLNELIKEYDYLRHKYDLIPLEGSRWRLLRLRPSNFPYIRLAQMAALLYEHPHLFADMIEKPDVKTLLTMLHSVQPSTYWQQHYVPDGKEYGSSRQLGRASAQSILINTVVPLIFSYAVHHQDEVLQDKAVQMLESLPPENNYIVRKWRSYGMKMENAADTQAFIQLFRNYCEAKKCMQCSIGYKVLTMHSIR